MTLCRIGTIISVVYLIKIMKVLQEFYVSLNRKLRIYFLFMSVACHKKKILDTL